MGRFITVFTRLKTYKGYQCILFYTYKKTIYSYLSTTWDDDLREGNCQFELLYNKKGPKSIGKLQIANFTQSKCSNAYEYFVCKIKPVICINY